jgi:hypothetical protein
MYAQKESLAIDGKAMYFRGRCQALALGLRPSDANPQSGNPWLIFLISEV